MGPSNGSQGQSLSPTLAQIGLGSNQSNEVCFSSPSIHEMGESPLLGMAIFAQLVGTRPGSTLMGLILPGLIRNRVEYGFKKKKKNPNRIRGLSKKSETRPETQPGYNPVFLKLPKNPPIYIAITNPKIPHFFSTQQQLAAHASLT